MIVNFARFYHDCGLAKCTQGQSHYVLVRIIPSIGSEKGPVTFSHITSVSLGSICLKSKDTKPLDSYSKNLVIMFYSNLSASKNDLEGYDAGYKNPLFIY